MMGVESFIGRAIALAVVLLVFGFIVGLMF